MVLQTLLTRMLLEIEGDGTGSRWMMLKVHFVGAVDFGAGNTENWHQALDGVAITLLRHRHRRTRH